MHQCVRTKEGGQQFVLNHVPSLHDQFASGTPLMQPRQVLASSGFNIVTELGFCEMPLTILRGEFAYEDFVVGGAIMLNLESSYIQYFHCQK